jgi:hypothetical protein
MKRFFGLLMILAVLVTMVGFSMADPWVYTPPNRSGDIKPDFYAVFLNDVLVGYPAPVACPGCKPDQAMMAVDMAWFSYSLKDGLNTVYAKACQGIPIFDERCSAPTVHLTFSHPFIPTPGLMLQERSPAYNTPLKQRP